MRVFHGVDDLQARVGEHLGYSSWHVIDQARIDAFAETTNDHQWIHTDPEKAASGPFGTTIAHGFLTLSLSPMLAWEVYKVEGISAGLNYGMDKVRFPTPVPVGSRVRASVKLTAVTPNSMGFQVATTLTIELEGSEKPACVLRMLSVVVP
jgi:acyl dehydratase